MKTRSSILADARIKPDTFGPPDLVRAPNKFDAMASCNAVAQAHGALKPHVGYAKAAFIAKKAAAGARPRDVVWGGPH